MSTHIFIVYIVFVKLLMVQQVMSNNLLAHLNKIASQSQYRTTEMANSFQMPFSLENIMATSIEMAIQSCQHSFQWEQWNCPSTDFFIRRTSRAYLIDREDAYVDAITTAALLYTITKSCSNGFITGCGCHNNNNDVNHQKHHKQSNVDVEKICSDNPEEAIQLYEKNINLKFSEDFGGSARQHNYKAITLLLKQALQKQENCDIKILKSFEEIAQDVRQMYDEDVQLMNVAVNSQVMWENVPMDALVYTKDSPNYCEPDAVPHWNGMRGRECQLSDAITDENTIGSCMTLCYACGYQVRSHQVVKEHQCNCQFTWAYQVHCDICITVDQQYYCY